MVAFMIVLTILFLIFKNHKLCIICECLYKAIIVIIGTVTTKMKCWRFGKHKSWLYWLLMLMMIVVLMVRQTQGGCIEEERNALLEIKASLMNSYGSDANHLLPTWVDNGSTIGGGGDECCDWERVKCNKTTGHVTMLALDNLLHRELENLHIFDFKLWPLNVSIFHHFEDLRSLNLSHDFLDNKIVKTELEKLSSLKKLETLDLSLNHDIDNDVLPSLTTLTSLRNLDLSYTGLRGYFPTNEFAAMENLETLNLCGCFFYGTFQIQGFERFPIMPKLKTLNLRSNYFNETVITSLSGFPLLKTLDLSSNWLSGTFPAQELAQLTNLEELDLSFNRFNHTSSIQDCKSLSRLKKLESIALGGNGFNKSIISCLSALPSLKILDLTDSNSLGSSFPIKELSGLRDLKKLDLSFCGLDSVAIFNAVPPYNMPTLEVLILSYNYFENGTLPIEALASNFPHLEILDMSDNFQAAGSIPSEIRALSSLRVLSLARNNLNGSIPDHAGLCELKNLEELDLSQNTFEGNLPRCFSSLSSLKRFDLSFNQFTGNIPSSLISNLTSLEYVDLSHNKFEGLFSMSSFFNHTKLEVVEFISDNDKFEVETEEPLDWIPMFQLRVLVLSNCNLNRASSSVPSFLLHQHKLETIDLSHNSLNGIFPNWLIENNTRLEYLNLRNNLLGGTIRVSPYPNFNTKWLDVSANHLTSTIPHDMGDIFPYIAYLNLSHNCLDGALPLSMGNLSNIGMLDLSSNNLSGEVPEGLLAHCHFLIVLQLSNNKLDGEVLSRKFGTRYLQVLLLDNNRFTGVLTNENNEGVLLRALDISGNFFSGVIPGWITNMTSLNVFVIRNNMFEGHFPCGTSPFMFLDMSNNSFSGSVPSCKNLQGVEHLHLNSNRFTGSVPKAYRDMKNLLTLDMGNNKLSGTIPSFLGELSSLRILFLRKNNFRGSIPKQLCKLSNVSLIDLSSNSLSGSIPNCLQVIAVASPSHLAFIDVSNSINLFFVTINLPRSFAYTSKAQNEVQFVTKSRPDTYKGGILDYMSGLDLSCNNLTGEIPKELGRLISIHALNFSHNQLTGPIPTLFSNMANIESLDLSSNNLSGNVPSELTKLYYLSTFIVANNNLSGRLPERKAQFGTFSANNYEGNPFLCGPPLERKCGPATNLTTMTPPLSAEGNEVKWYDVDMVFFGASLVSTWIVFLMGFVGLLYVNPYWRRRWFAFVKQCMYTCYYFIYDSLHRRKF